MTSETSPVEQLTASARPWKVRHGRLLFASIVSIAIILAAATIPMLRLYTAGGYEITTPSRFFAQADGIPPGSSIDAAKRRMLLYSDVQVQDLQINYSLRPTGSRKLFGLPLTTQYITIYFDRAGKITKIVKGDG